jgi:hypothetical protein
VRAVVRSVSVPTPITQELFRVVITVPVGAPVLALVLAVAPIASEPFVPDVDVPVKATTVMDAGTLWLSVAVTVTFVRRAGAKALQISAVPFCVFVLTTRVQVREAPETADTLVFVPNKKPPETNATNSSFVEPVENAAVLRLELNEFWSTEILVSIAIAALAVKFTAVTLAPLTTTLLLAGVKVKFVLAGVTV